MEFFYLRHPHSGSGIYTRERSPMERISTRSVSQSRGLHARLGCYTNTSETGHNSFPQNDSVWFREFYLILRLHWTFGCHYPETDGFLVRRPLNNDKIRLCRYQVQEQHPCHAGAGWCNREKFCQPRHVISAKGGKMAPWSLPRTPPPMG